MTKPGPSVRIAEQIWPAWRAQADEYDEPALELLFVPDGPVPDVAHAMGETVLEVQEQYVAEANRSDDPEPPFVGEWSWMAVAEGVVVQVVECDVLEEVLPAVSAGLERRGIAGAFDLYEPPHPELPQGTVHLLECAVRVRGERASRGPTSFRWQADQDAVAAVLAGAERWCRRIGESANWSLSVGTVGPVAIDAGEQVLDRLIGAAADGNFAALSAVADDRFRSVCLHLSSGSLSLRAGGARLDRDRWRETLAELVGVLREHADLLAYGFVKRGWGDVGAHGISTFDDWPDRPDRRPYGSWGTPDAFDDVFAPDAYGVQLLGPGYAGRVPESASWRRERVGSAGLIVEHTDAAAWFGAPFLQLGSIGPPAERPKPPVLVQAREELAPILYTPGALGRAGYVDDESL